MCDVVNQMPLSMTKTPSDEVRATRSVTAWGELGLSAAHLHFTDGFRAHITLCNVHAICQTVTNGISM